MKRCVIYARISITSEESVSVERQIESARNYAAARGWEVVADPFVDDGVSATHNKPEDRNGWRSLLATQVPYDVVIVWKVDRLARRVLDFLQADESLQKRNAGLVAVDDPIDMSTAQGRAFAQMLAVFGELEAAGISARVKAARAHLLRSGRVVGGSIPYGWKSIPNPDGPGKVLALDPDRIDYVREAVTRTLAGRSLYSTVQWLDEVGAPVPRANSKKRIHAGWSYTTLERLLKNPVLAGMTPFNPGNDTRQRGAEVLRGEDGLPVVDESVAIVTPSEHRELVQAIDERQDGRRKPVALRAKTSGLLSGLVFCGDERHETPVRMYRGTTQGRPGYNCPDCSQTISNFEDLVIREFLDRKGTHVRWTPVTEVYEGGAAILPEIEQRLDELDTLIRDASDREERRALQRQQADLLDLRDEKRAEAPEVTLRYEPASHFGEAWAAAEEPEDQRAVLADALDQIIVRRGRPGRRTEAQLRARLDFRWLDPTRLGPAPEHLTDVTVEP